MIVVGFALAAAVATLIRVELAGLDSHFDRRLWATIAVNLGGSFALGVLWGSEVNTMTIAGIAALGSITTFSTFISQVVCIGDEGTTRNAVLVAVGSIVAGVSLAWVGLQVG